jgi:hypothetical protein
MRMFRLVKERATCCEGSVEGVVARRAWSLGRREGVRRRSETERVGSRVVVKRGWDPEAGEGVEAGRVMVKGALSDRV